MKSIYLKKLFVTLGLVYVLSGAAQAQSAARAAVSVEEKNVRGQMEFLAGDAMRGRGSGTEYELLTGVYIASQLRQFGVEPAGAGNSYIQTITTTRTAFSAPPKLTYAAGGAGVVLEHGREMIVLGLSQAETRGPLQKITLDDKPRAGAVAFVRLRETDAPETVNQKLMPLFSSGAAAVVVEETPAWRARWEAAAGRRLSFSKTEGVGEARNAYNLIVVSRAAAAALAAVPEGTEIVVGGETAAPQSQKTWNAVGKISGTDAALSSEVVLLSAHMDHLGVRENAPGDDKIFNGADDDASGCVAVLELARALAAGPRPKRTVYFAFFGSEEAGGTGSQYFVATLPFPKEKLVANLQFEMIGRADPKVPAEHLWLTGFERSTLGAELARQGARLVADPHPQENFFQRSDNYTLARQGIVAHTVSSFNLHTDYHRASDEIDKIDFVHMTRAIDSMINPVRWLVNSDFKPSWHEGKKP